ncbi:UDP-glucose:undecaprenyl-phosphate glucose-1-phosphate transferase [Rosistilla oblonga]|uniref:undecaprenyl-phosphate glucose phosphotransferase n=1 Tax=Rosistilla oblonga TaxID=2527990 RepID=UPI00118BCB3E|nr:undecaprenyl-phosphate glucose phosphotransferase [Rosistilla oblonga]QDV11916.1 UDP-glucose:undecaprenyl-phosphate glucose-1-phosphate transferase [Rosistilla oblonga]
MQSITPIRPRQRSIEFLRLLIDGAAIIGTLAIVKGLSPGWFDNQAIVAGLTAILAFLLLGHVTGLYRAGLDMTANQEVVRVTTTWVLTMAVIAGLAFFARYGQHFARSVVLGWCIIAPVMICLIRMIWRVGQRMLLKQGIGTRRVAIAGLNDLGLQVSRNIEQSPGLGFQLTGFYDDRERERRSELGPNDPQLLGKIDDLIVAAQNNEFDIVMISLPMRAEERIKFILEKLSDSTASVYIVPDFFVFELMHSQWTNMGGIPAVSVFESPLYGVDGVSKRLVDIAVTISALVAAAIPMLMIAAAIKLTSPGPVFFRQRRYGVDGREILVWKFRSMTTCDNGSVVRQATKGDARITPLGAILRKTSLDELPQLFNVLEGSMSLVGPRPHASAHNEHYRGQIRGYMLRHKIKPGITGLAQVEGCRGETDTLDKMQRRVDFDHRYIRDWSLWLDIRILFKTLLVAWRQPEAY